MSRLRRTRLAVTVTGRFRALPARRLSFARRRGEGALWLGLRRRTRRRPQPLPISFGQFCGRYIPICEAKTDRKWSGRRRRMHSRGPREGGLCPFPGPECTGFAQITDRGSLACAQLFAIGERRTHMRRPTRLARIWPVRLTACLCTTAFTAGRTRVHPAASAGPPPTPAAGPPPTPAAVLPVCG